MTTFIIILIIVLLIPTDSITKAIKKSKETLADKARKTADYLDKK